MRFHKDYGALDDRILPYLNHWLYEYAAYYELDPGLLAALPQMVFDNYVAMLEDVQTQEKEKIVRHYQEWITER